MERKSNLELLRIIGMIMIVTGHYSYWGAGNIESLLGLNKLFLEFLLLGGKVGVNIFILISFYFLVKQNLKIDKLIHLIIKVKIFSIFGVIYGIIFLDKVNIKIIIKSLFPIIFNQYWFITAYVLILIFSPFFNLLLSKINKIEIKKILILLLSLYCILQTFLGVRLYYNEIIWFTTIYILSFYIRNYLDIIKFKNKKLLLLGIGLYILIFIGTILGKKYLNIDVMLGRECTILGLAVALCTFIFSINLKMKNSKSINYIAEKVLTVYLIHENIFLREAIWNNLLHVKNIIDESFFILFSHSIISVIIIFFISIFLDEIVEWIYKLIFKRIVDTKKSIAEYKLKNIVNNIMIITEKFEK